MKPPGLKCGEIDLPVGCQGKGIDHHQERWNHVVGQPRAQEPFQLLAPGRCLGRRGDEVGNELFASIAADLCMDCCLDDLRVL